MTDRILIGIGSTVCASLLTASIVGGTSVWKDVELLKEQVALNKEELVIKQKSAEQFQEFLNQMDKALALQTQTVQSLEVAVKELQVAVYSNKGGQNDRRN